MTHPDYPGIFAALAARFDPSEVRTRQAAGGRVLSFITSRTARRRLNDVLGPWGWSNAIEAGDGWVRCSITITLPDGKTITREALGGYRDTQSPQDRSKAGDSDAFKRACVLFGVGEYLYGERVYTGQERPAGAAAHPATDGPAIAPTGNQGPSRANGAAAANGYRKARHEWAGAQGAAGRGTTTATATEERRAPDGRARAKVPHTGRALFAWLRDQEQAGAVGLLKHVGAWGLAQEFPRRLVDWDREQVAAGYAEARRRLAGDGLEGRDDG